MSVLAFEVSRMTDLDLAAIRERYTLALNAKPSKGPYSEKGITALTDSVCDVPELMAEIDRLNATIGRVRDVLAKWEATQVRNRQIFNNPAWFHIESIDCTGDLHRALEGGEQ